MTSPPTPLPDVRSGPDGSTVAEEPSGWSDRRFSPRGRSGGAMEVMELDSCRAPTRIRVKLQDRVFVVEKKLLTQNCEYFQALFRSGMKESGSSEVRLPSVGVLGFLVLIQVLEGERPMLDSDQIVEAVQCAAFLQAPALTRHLIRIVDSENCLLMFHTAATFGVRELLHGAALFIRDMYQDLREDLRVLPESLVDYVSSLSPSSYVAVCSHSPSSELLPDLQRNICYLDEDLGDWKVLTSLPVCASTTMAGVAVLENRLYIIGGVHDVSKRAVESGFCFDPGANAWSQIPGPRQRRYNLTLLAHEDSLYAIGGEYNRAPLASVEKFKASGGAWCAAPQLPSAAASVASAAAMGRIFICLWRGNGATDIHELVPEAEHWALVTTLVREQSYGIHMVAHRDNLYMMRNGPCDDFLRCVMDRYNLSTGQWSSVMGQFGNSKGALLTAVVRGDSAFTLGKKVTSEYAIRDGRWCPRREMKGFGRIGSIYTFLMRLPASAPPANQGFTGLPRNRHTSGRRIFIRCCEDP